MGLKRLLSMGLAVPISVTSVLVIGVAHASSADLLGLNPVTVDCGDGARMSANLDLAALTKLENVMQDMLLYPTGESCTLSHERHAEDGESHPFVIGAGQYHSDICHLNFHIRAFINEDGVHGVQSATFPPDTPVDCGGPGTVKATVTCLSVAGKLAQMKGIVTKSTGQFASFAPIGSAIGADVQDSPHGTPDMIDQFTSGTDQPCQATMSPIFPIDRGDIEVES